MNAFAASTVRLYYRQRPRALSWRVAKSYGLIVLYTILHKLIVAIYMALPVAAVVFDARRQRRKNRAAPSGGLAMTICAAVALGTSLSLVYALAVGGRVIV